MTALRDKIDELLAARPRTKDRAQAPDPAVAKLGYATIFNANDALNEHDWYEFVQGLTEVLQDFVSAVSVTNTAFLLEAKPMYGVQLQFVIEDGDPEGVATTLKNLADWSHVEGRWAFATLPLDSYQYL